MKKKDRTEWDILKVAADEVKYFARPPKDQIKTIKVENCKECVFCNYHLVYSVDFCRLNNLIKIDRHDQLPEDKTHDKCPLKHMNYRIRLK